MKVQGFLWNRCTEEERRTFYGVVIKEYDHDRCYRRIWLIQFGNYDADQDMCYDCVLRYAEEDASTFHDFKLPANPFLPPQNEVIHDNERFVIDKMNWTEVLQDTNNPEVRDKTPIPFTGEREQFDVEI